MAQYSNLKAYIEEKIYENGTQAITGDILQDVLKVMTDDLGEFYQTGGVASPSTDPGTPDAKVIYFATEAGTYTNFGGITLAAGEVALLIFETRWTKVELNVLSSANGGVKTANLADGAVTTEKIAGGAVETAKIANSAVTSGKVADGAIGTAKIADGAIDADKIAANAVESAKIKNGAVTEGKINDGAVTAGKVAANAVTTAKIADDAVTTAKLNDGAVTEDKIATDAVTSGKVKDGAIGTAKIAAGAVTHAKIGAGAVEESNIKDGAVTSDKIANGAVGSDQLAEGAFSAENLADGSVTTDKLADEAVTAEKIADGAVTAGKFANGSVTTIKLGSGAVTTEKIGDGMVTRQKLADSSVSTSKIIDGAVTTDKVADGAITDAKLENPVSVSQNTETGKTQLEIGGTPALTVDFVPESGSKNLVESGGVADDFGKLERRTLYSKTINLYDKDSLEKMVDVYLDKNGVWHNLSGMLVTPFIPVIEDETYYISGWGATITMRFVTAYDADYNVLPEKGADNAGTVNSYTCPSGVAFIRITTYKALKDMMICTTSGVNYVPFEAITTKELYDGKLNKNAVVNTFTRSETDVLSSDANGLFIAKTANKKITRFSQVAANQIGSASFYTWGKDRFCGYVKQTDSYTYKIMIYQYDASKSLIGYGTIWPKSYTFDNAIANAVYFRVIVMRRNADDTADVNLSIADLSGFEVYTNYEDSDLDGLTKLDNSIFTLLNTNNGMLTKAVCKWQDKAVTIKCRGSLKTQAMIYQYDKDFNSLGYTQIWDANYTETPKENAVYFDIRVAKNVDGSYQPITQEDLQYIDIYSNYVPFNKGITINMLGDSLTAEGNIVNALQKFGYKVNNYGVSGTSIAGTGSTSFISRFSAMTNDCDIVLVLGGVNDWRNGVYMGNFENLYDSQDPLYGNTFFSALHILCGGLKDKYINDNSAKLVIFATPMHNQFSLEGYPDLPEFVIEDNKIVPQSYGNGTTLDKYVEAIKKVCEYYAIPVIDLYAKSYIAPIQDDNKTKYTNDGLHPNTAGGKLMAEAIMRELIFNM